jgi:hypothetical protein
VKASKVEQRISKASEHTTGNSAADTSPLKRLCMYVRVLADFGTIRRNVLSFSFSSRKQTSLFVHPSSNLTLPFRAMAAKALANEAYLEEYNRLELELKQLQHELSDSVVLNDELTKVISQKVHYLCRHSTLHLFLKSFQRTAGGRVADQRQTAGVLTG